MFTDTAGVPVTHTYNTLGLLVSTTDALGHTTGYAYDAADRLVSVDGVACSYDDRGNLLSDGT